MVLGNYEHKMCEWKIKITYGILQLVKSYAGRCPTYEIGTAFWKAEVVYQKYWFPRCSANWL